jgi:hypothetical protein
MAYVENNRMQLTGLGRARFPGPNDFNRDVRPMVTYARGFVPPTRRAYSVTVADAISQGIRIPAPIPKTPFDGRPGAVSLPIPMVSEKAAFETAEAIKYGFSRSVWLSLGSSRRSQIRLEARRALPETVIAAPVPTRVVSTNKGPTGITLEDQTGTMLPSTRAGFSLDDIIRIDPIKIDVEPETVVAGPPAYLKYGLWAIGAYVLYSTFAGSTSKPRRRRRPRRSRSRRR